MDTFFKYLTVGDEDKDWGLYLNTAGKVAMKSGEEYPSKEHPSGYYFSWEKGRVLQEYQILYITEGLGIYETADGAYSIRGGNLIIIPKGVWHRYRPEKHTGWAENYIGFSGHLADHYFERLLFLLEKPVIHYGVREEFIDTYHKIFDLVQSEKPGLQQVASGMVIKLLGYIIAFEKQKTFSGKRIEKIIRNVRFQIRENLSSEINLKLLAAENNIGYSYFRKMFKEYTGVSPRQYHLDLRFLRAKELILTSNKSMKEISFELGFQSVHYFSRFFKAKAGINPSELRRQG